jgi:hypothetical protein
MDRGRLQSLCRRAEADDLSPQESRAKVGPVDLHPRGDDDVDRMMILFFFVFPFKPNWDGMTEAVNIGGVKNEKRRK